MDLNALVKMLADHPGFGVAVLALAALVYVFKLYVTAQEAHLQTALTLAPITSKLAEILPTIERLLEHREKPQ